MKVKPILDKWEIKGIESITSLEDRKLAEHTVPGKTGNVFQDLGSKPTEITITGSLHGDEVREGFLKEVRKRYKAAQPVTFVADITTATEIKYVVIKDLRFLEKANDPDHFKYKIVLNESPPPPPPPNPAGAIDAGLLNKAKGFADTIGNIADLGDMLKNIPNFGDPTKPLNTVLDDVDSTLGGLESARTSLNNLFGGSE